VAARVQNVAFWRLTIPAFSSAALDTQGRFKRRGGLNAFDKFGSHHIFRIAGGQGIFHDRDAHAHDQIQHNDATWELLSWD